MGIAKLLLYLVIGYTTLLIFVYIMQQRLLYFPANRIPSKKQIQTLGLEPWPEGGLDCHGFISIEHMSRSKGTVIVFHGNAGAAWHRDHYVKDLEPLGYRVVLAEYPGYGGRSGRLREKEFLMDAERSVRLVYEKYGKPIFLCGESLGCAVATGVAASSQVHIEGLVLITPWDSLPNLAERIYWYLPARWLVRDKYNNIRNMEGFQDRVAVAIAEYDEIVPKRHGIKFFEALSCEKKLWILTGAGHNTWPEIIDVSWWREVMDFVAGTGGKGSK